MAGLLYDKELNCSLCSGEFTTKYVRSSKTILDDRDSDFCPYYQNNENPVFYKPIICPRCGYGALKKNFKEITDEEKVKVLDRICRHWNGRDHGGLRDLEEAIRCYKHIQKNAEVMEKKASIQASISIRLAWCYRYKESKQETRQLREALSHYKKAYMEEKLPIGNMDAVTLLYLIGEINRKLGNVEEARRYFSEVIEHPKKSRNPRIVKLTRDQWQMTKKDEEKGT